MSMFVNIDLDILMEVDLLFFLSFRRFKFKQGLWRNNMGIYTCKINYNDIFTHEICPYKNEICFCILLWNHVPSSFEVVEKNIQITVTNVCVFLSCIKKNKIYPSYNSIHLQLFLAVYYDVTRKASVEFWGYYVQLGLHWSLCCIIYGQRHWKCFIQ